MQFFPYKSEFNLFREDAFVSVTFCWRKIAAKISPEFRSDAFICQIFRTVAPHANVALFVYRDICLRNEKNIPGPVYVCRYIHPTFVFV